MSVATEPVQAFASEQAQRIVKNALPQKRAMRELCALMNSKHPGMSSSDMAKVLASMGFNFFTATTTSQEWRKEHGMRP